jgi:hypothetical protein
MRMHMRRYTRLINAHSKKFENHCHMVALYTVWSNFVRINSAVKTSPAMAANLTGKLWEMADLVALIDADAPALSEPPAPPSRNVLVGSGEGRPAAIL